MQKTLNFDIAMFLIQLGGYIPMIQQHTTIHSFLVLAKLLVAFYCILSHSCKRKSICKLIQKRVILWNLVDNLREAVIIFNHCKTLNESFVVFSRKVELSSLVPFQSFWVVIAQLIGHFIEGLVITWTLSDHLKYSKPVSNFYSHVDSQIFSLDSSVYVLSQLIFAV